MFLLAPDGQFLSRRWRNAAAVPAVGMLFCTLSVLISNPTTFDLQSRDDGLVRGLLLSFGFLLIVVGLVASVASMVVRLRRSRGEIRQQLLPIALSAAALVIGIAWVVVVQSNNGGEQTWAARCRCSSPTSCPVLFSIAVLRYRLYDIEVIVNRTVVVAVGTGFAAVGYTALVVTVGKEMDRQTSGFWLSLLGDRPGRPGVPAASPLGGPSREPVGLRLPGPALRSAVRLQRPPRRDAVPGDPAAGRGRRGRAGRVGTPGRGEPRGAGRADDVSPLGPRRRRWHRRARGRGTHGEHPTGHHRGVDPQGTPTAAVRHPAADGDLRPGGGRLPQRGDGEPAGGTRGRARPHHAGARRLALEDHRGGRRGTADPRGGHLARGAATPGGDARRAPAVLAKPSLSGRPRTVSTFSWPPPTTRSSRSAS